MQTLLFAKLWISENINTICKKKLIKQKKIRKLQFLKELKLRPGTEIHDYNFKIKNAKKFLTKGDKVKFTVKFKGREMQHVQLGKEFNEKNN